jgi:SAM-dependent methyltransferase
MSAPFGDDYADVYDRMYATKDYSLECDVIERVVPRSDPPAHLLDLGCGTGNHALTLIRRGYSVTGVDRSEAMVRAAERKASAEGLPLPLIVGDLADVEVSGSFEAVTIMFAVLGYLTETPQLLAALSNVRRHLGVGGKLIFDVWYGPAVLTNPPVERTRIFEGDGEYVIRSVRPEMSPQRDVVDVHTRLWRVEGDRVRFDSDEVHSVRYFFIPELTHLLTMASFRVERFFAFPQIDSSPTVTSWNLGCVATAI